MTKRIDITDYGAISGGGVLCTDAIQSALDKAAELQCEVYVPQGVYLTGALFLKSNVSLYLEKGAVLLGTTEESAYPIKRSRVAGVEMDWPCGILNVFHASHVRIHGLGTVDGQGQYWWNKYWGEDRCGGMRREYEEKGLRWAVDYDCRRIRNVIVYECNDVHLEGFCSVRSGFWNIHICYSENVRLKELTISDNNGPSTDGIDIDSCNGVLVEKCKISCNDDNVCIKSGRDADGLRVNRICENIMVRDCEILEGAGVTLGSETSGGIRNISVCDNVFKGTHYGFRMKSAKTRGGLVEDVTVENLKMEDVCCCFCFDFDWHPAYSYCEIPADYKGEIPQHWHVLTEKVPEGKGIPCARNMHISKVTSVIREGYEGSAKAFSIEGLPEAPFENLAFEEVQLQAKEYGTIANVKNLHFVDVTVDIV